MKYALPVSITLLLCCGSAQAILLFGLDNSANQTDPGTGVPFDAVARVSNALSGEIGGSAVHLGNGWMLTADHVGSIAYTTFDGITFYNRDISKSPFRIGNTDMKLFRLDTTPTVGAAQLYFGTGETTAPATLVGFGRGRNPSVAVNSTSVTWGNLATSAKRWGLNRPADLFNDSYTLNSIDYEQLAIRTVLGNSPTGLGANEAALVTHDSGSGMFQQIGGVWYLIGLAVSVEVVETSVFDDDSIASPTRGHINSFVRISTYYDEIIQKIPEPSTSALSGLLALLVITRRYKQKS